MRMAELERIDAATDAWADKLEHIRRAALHHLFEGEGIWFLELRQDYEDQSFLTRRFREEFERYAGQPAPTAEHRSFADDDGATYQKPLG